MFKTIIFYFLAFLVVVLLILIKARIFLFFDLLAFLWVILGSLLFTCILYNPKEIYNAVVSLKKKGNYVIGAQLFKRLEENTMNMVFLGVILAFINLLIHWSEGRFIGPSMGFAFLVSLYGITLSKLIFLPCRIKLEMDANPQSIPKITDWRIFVLLPFLFLFFFSLFRL